MKKRSLFILILLIVSLILGSCRDIKGEGNVTTVSNTVEESTNKMPTEPLVWTTYSYTPFAVVTITEKTDEVEKLMPEGSHTDFVDYRKYRCEIEYSLLNELLGCDIYIDFEKSFEGGRRIYLADNEKTDVKAGDTIFVQVTSIVMNNEIYYCGVVNDSYEAEYLKFTGGKVLIDEKAIQTKSFVLIEVINEEIRSRLESEVETATPSFPKKQLYGEATLDDIREYFTSFRKALEEYDQYKVKYNN